MQNENKSYFIKDGKWRVAWTDDVLGTLTQRKTIEEAKENLIDAIHEMQKPIDISFLPKREVILQEIEV